MVFFRNWDQDRARHLERIRRGEIPGISKIPGIWTRSILSFLFNGGIILCLNSADVNNDNRLDLADPVFSLRYLFIGGPQPSSPYPNPGVEPADDDPVGCEG